MQKREQLYEGKAKRVYATDDPNVVKSSRAKVLSTIE